MIVIKTKEQIEIIKQGGRILAVVMEKIAAEVKPGATTGRLEEVACSLIKAAGGRPSFKGYESGQDGESFPTALCVSINNEVVHVPSLPSRMLKEGDIIGVDLGMEYPVFVPQRGSSAGKPAKQGYYTDMAMTVPVGKISREARRLIDVTRKSLELAIKEIKPGNTLNDIGRAVQTYVEANGFSVVRGLVGHGVGLAVHEEPQVPNFVIEKEGCNNMVFKPGMVLAVEPMVNAGDYEIKYGDDHFSVLTADGSLSAHFEHTVAVTEGGHIVLTEL